MLKNRTVFVIGAGASAEFGLPVGADLANEISEKLDIRFDDWGSKVVSGDADLFQNVIQKTPNEANEYQQAAWLIRDGIVLANSIDDFLHVHRHDARVVKYGKAAIAKCILEAERKSTLYYDPNSQDSRKGNASIDFAGRSDTWLVKFFRLLGRGLAHSDRANVFENVSFAIFNYDRCIEYFFLNALQRFYNIDIEEARSIIAKAQFLHAYGTPGELFSAQRGDVLANYGQTRADYLRVSETVKTYTESVESRAIKQAIFDSEQIVFLGFAYHAPNLSLLADNRSLRLKRILGTGFGMSPSDIETTAHEISLWAIENYDNAMKARVTITAGMKAADLIDYYSKTL